MSLLAATQIPKPADEQAFERASIVLWRGLLKDPNVQRNGRRGQRQNGVDLFGIRDDDPERHVGIQCKLKGDGHILTEEEVQEEVKKAQTFKPPLKEYFIITTAPDDVALQELARELTAKLNKSGTKLRVYVWGWNTLEEKISEDAAARKAFDPSFGPFSEQILDETQKIGMVQREARTETTAGFSRIDAKLTEVVDRLSVPPGDTTVALGTLEAHLDAEIDNYRDIATAGMPRTALPFLEKLLERVQAFASGRILFRIKANIGSCLLALGDDQEAASILAAAYEHAPDEPKAVANKAFSLLLQGKWQELLSFGVAALDADPTNEGLAGYLVQAARFDPSITEPLDLIPDALKDAAAVEIGRVDYIRRRRPAGEWWAAAREAAVAHPNDPHAVQFTAEADLDEILTSESYQRTRLLTPDERTRLEAAATALAAQWDRERVTDGVLRAEDAALCGNLIVALHTLDELPKALEVARQGLALAPSDADIISRAAVVAIDGDDDVLAEELLAKLPDGPDATVLRSRFYSAHGNWAEVARLYERQAEDIPAEEEALIATAGKLAAIKVGERDGRAERIKAVADEAARDPRASIVVADFARLEQLDDIAESAFQAALGLIDENSHIASRMMVAHHAALRGDWAIVGDLLDGHVAEDRDSEQLRMLARAFVNDSPIRQRALRFFDRLPQRVRELPFFLHSEGFLHFNRGALRQAETALRKAIEVQPDLDNYLALFSVLRRRDRDEEVRPVLDSIDLATVVGTPGQKMYLAQLLRAAGYGPRSLAYAYDVLQSAKNDPDVALRYFGLIMMSPDDGLIPVAETAAVDTWVRLENEQGQNHSFLIEEGEDRPSEGIFSPTHPTAAAASGLKVGDTFEMPAAFGDSRQWRVAEIKHKYLHALHDVMENFEKRFPDAKGFYKVTMAEGDIQPALEQVRRVSESNRKLADLYLLRNLPLNMVAAHMGGDTIGFVEYIRSLDFDIRTCIGTETERLAARSIITQHRASGAVLDAYAAWTVAAIDAFDVLKGVFGALVVPQSVIDELRSLRDKQEHAAERSMTVAWHNGEFIKQEHTAEDVAVRRTFIAEQITKIEESCEVKPATAPDNPLEIASLITGMFDTHVLDAANLAAEGCVLVSEDMHFRQIAEAACSVEAVWLQPVLAFASEIGQIDRTRYVDAVVKLAWRRHGHLSLDAGVLLDALQTDDTNDLLNFQALANFIGTKNAEMRSHLNVSMTVLNHIWEDGEPHDLKRMQATSILVDRLIRNRGANWALTLAFIKSGSVSHLREYLDGWIGGHFLPADEFARAEAEMTNRIRTRRLNSAVPTKARGRKVKPKRSRN